MSAIPEKTDRFNRTFILKQNTPLIHYQAEEEGATLLGSELKPALDRFLYGRYRDRLPFVAHDNTTHTLDYKVHCFADENGRKNDIDLKQYKSYFGHQGKTNPPKGVKSPSIRVRFFSYHEDILDVITDEIALFLMLHNFGTRNNKGFGSFMLEKKPNLDDVLSRHTGHMKVKYQNQASERILNHVAVLYALMKGGINKPYNKGYIFNYFLAKKIGNEKRYIKETFEFARTKKGEASTKVSSDGLEKHYVRALLGMAPFIFFNGRPEKKSGIRRKGTVTISSDTIKRAPSPVFFKIIDDTLYIIPREIPHPLLGHTFTFRLRGFSKQQNVPVSFDLPDFIRAFFDQLKFAKTTPLEGSANDIRQAQQGKYQWVGRRHS